jgi:predicted ATP-grasp superfamily ATP-dependent carboligase
MNTLPVIICGNDNINNLGVVRALGRHDVPAILLTSNTKDVVRYSRYTSQRFTFYNQEGRDDADIEFLLNMGRQTEEKRVIIPTNDSSVLKLSRYKKELEQYFLLPIPEIEVVEKLVNKKNFYQFLDQISAPFPKTYFVDDVTELSSIGEEIRYPYILKPYYSHLFVKELKTKCFFIDSPQKLKQAIENLQGKHLDAFIQEIIPGNEHYSLLTYFNRESMPYATCGWDKISQDPPLFGNSSVLCKSEWREEPINLAFQALQKIKYYGIAEPEFKKDPRDNKYKFLEINARISIPNALPPKCGTDITYIAYLDTIGQYHNDSRSPQSGILWVDEINYPRVFIKQIVKRETSILDVIRSLKGKKVYATWNWNDPLPLLVSMINLGLYYLGRIFPLHRLFQRNKKSAQGRNR